MTPTSSTTASKTRNRNSDVDLGLLPDLVGFHLRQAQITIFRDFAQSVGKYEITPGLFGVLVLIESNPGLTQTKLARATHLDRSSIVSVIDKLEARGLVKRRRGAEDRRSNALQITTQGTQLLKTLKRLVSEHEKRLTRELSQQERATLVRLLKKIFPEQR